MNNQEGAVSKLQEKYLLQTHELINRIITRKIGRLHFDSIEDVKQQIFLKLWRWKSKRQDKDLSEEEWLKLANTVAHNEVNDFFSEKHNQTILFSQMDENQEEIFSSVGSAAFDGNSAGGNKPEGAAQAETRSLLKLIWKLMQSLTLRQKYAYLLHQPDFIIDFIAAECCSMKELADYFEIEEKEFSEIFEQYPLSDERIAFLLQKKLNKKITVQNIWKARSEAKKRIAKHLAEYINHGRLSNQRRT